MTATNVRVSSYLHSRDGGAGIADLHQRIRAWQVADGSNEVFGDDSRADLSDIPGHYLEAGGNFWVARDGDRVVGFVGLRRISHATATVKRLAVDPAYHRQGIGTRLVAALMDYAHAKAEADVHPLREVTLSTGEDEHGRAIYERFGFEVVGFDARCRDHLMRADLAAVLAGVR